MVRINPRELWAFVVLCLLTVSVTAGDSPPSCSVPPVVIEPGSTNQYRHATTAPARIKVQYNRQVSHRDTILQVRFYGQIVEEDVDGNRAPVIGAHLMCENRRILAFSARDWDRNPVISGGDGSFSCEIPVMAVREQDASGRWVLTQTSTTPVWVRALGYKPTVVLVRYEQPRSIIVLERKRNSPDAAD